MPVNQYVWSSPGCVLELLVCAGMAQYQLEDLVLLAGSPKRVSGRMATFIFDIRYKTNFRFTITSQSKGKRSQQLKHGIHFSCMLMRVY